MCLTSLSFSQYGIAQPMTPKNPHTNLPWTLAQRVSIVHQLAVCSLNRHTFLPPGLIWYREVQYSIPAFYDSHYDALNLWAAHSFFSKPTDSEVRIITCELVEDLYKDLDVLQHGLRGSLLVRERIKARTLSVELMRSWDNLLISMWILENHNRPHNGYTSYHQLLTAAGSLHTRTLLWCTARERERVRLVEARGVAAVQNPPPE